MKDLSLFENTEKTVTTKELALSLGVTPQTIRDTVERLGLAKSILQVKIRGQISFAFTEEQATAIKIELQNHSKIAQNGFNTLTIANDLEAWELQKRLDAYKDRRIAELTAENERMKPKEIVYDDFLSRDKFCNFRDGANYLGISQSEFMDILKSKYIYKNNIGEYRAYAEYTDYFTLRPFARGAERTGQQLMLNLQGLEYFKTRIKKGA